jgi:hypothetical protein
MSIGVLWDEVRILSFVWLFCLNIVDICVF